MSNEVDIVRNCWIPLSDGSRLSARLWLPPGAKDEPVPALLEYLPYRKGDTYSVGDARMHAYFAKHGYACARVDIRGTGESDGVLVDEYLEQEQDDALDVIAWLADQPWCSGRVGMLGMSWGGFNSLQVAARRPPALRAIISACSTDDRYTDDVHYIGGSVLATDMPIWGSMVMALAALPPDPDVVGESWRAMWQERLDASQPVLDEWLSHPSRDAFWEQGSVAEDYDAIECPVYMVGGWADAYTNAVMRFLEGYSGPRKGLLGPWGHCWPHRGAPGPAIGFLQEALRWWDHWLKDVDTGVMSEPMLRAWMQDWVTPGPTVGDWPGRWVAEETWPSPRIESSRFALRPGRLVPGAEGHGTASVSTVESHGLDGGVWMPYGGPGDLPGDQRAEDGRALCFDSEPLEGLELLGVPELTCQVTADARVALLVARLCVVDQDGSSLLISRGILNLCHRDGHADPEPIEPGHSYSVRIRLNAVGHAIRPGQKLRLALSPSYWPIAWPSPTPVTLGFDLAESHLRLPVRPEDPNDAQLAPFGEPEEDPGQALEILERAPLGHSVSYERTTGRWTVTYPFDRHRTRLAESNGLEFSYLFGGEETYAITEGLPLSAQVRRRGAVEIGRGRWRTRVEVTCVMDGDHENFRTSHSLHAYEGDRRVFTRSWERVIPRGLG